MAEDAQAADQNGNRSFPSYPGFGVAFSECLISQKGLSTFFIVYPDEHALGGNILPPWNS